MVLSRISSDPGVRTKRDNGRLVAAFEIAFCGRDVAGAIIPISRNIYHNVRSHLLRRELVFHERLAREEECEYLPAEVETVDLNWGVFAL